jgi:hypothetical protein
MLDVLGYHVGFNIEDFEDCKPEDIFSSDADPPDDILTPEEVEELIQAGLTQINRMIKKKNDACDAERAAKMTVCMLMVRPDSKNETFV